MIYWKLKKTICFLLLNISKTKKTHQFDFIFNNILFYFFSSLKVIVYIRQINLWRNIRFNLLKVLSKVRRNKIFFIKNYVVKQFFSFLFLSCSFRLEKDWLFFQTKFNKSDTFETKLLSAEKKCVKLKCLFYLSNNSNIQELRFD